MDRTRTHASTEAEGTVSAVWRFPVKSMLGEQIKALARHNRLDVGGAPYPCAGVYATTESPGTIREGDEVRLV